MCEANEPKAVRGVLGTVTSVDLETGEETHAPMIWNVLPPAKGKCQICAAEHHPDDAHNAHSLYYRMVFASMIGRSPTWSDAIAHCPDGRRQMWEAELRKRGHWSEPPEGQKPVKHHGVD